MTEKFLLIAGYPGALINFRGPLLRALLAEGLEVCVVAPDLPVNCKIRQQLETLNIQVYEVALNRTGINLVSDVITVYQLWSLMHRIKPDYTLGYTIKPVIYGSFAAWLARVPKRFALITGLGYAFTDGAGGNLRSLVRMIASRLYQHALSKVEAVFFQNPDDEQAFLQQGITGSSSRTRVVNGSGINLCHYAVAPLPDQPIFLLIARLLGDKGVRAYVEAARLVKGKHPQAKFELVGWIDENPDSIDKVELDDWVNEGVIDFKGKLSDVQPAITGCSVYVLPSYREGTPRTVLEAMSMGRPIITTRAPGCRETVVDGYNGFLVSVKAVDELVSAMLKFIEQPELVVSMGSCSRKLAEEKYDVHKVNDVMLKEMGIKP